MRMGRDLPVACRLPKTNLTTLAFRTLSTVEPILPASMKPLFAVELTPRMPSWNMELTCGLNFHQQTKGNAMVAKPTSCTFPHPIAL